MFAGNLDGQSIRIGELLVLSGALQSGDVVEAVTVSKRLAMPVGRVLIVSGCITEELLEASLQAQILMWEGSISVELAEAALKLVSFTRIPLHEALGELHWDATFDTDTAGLAGLLRDANILSPDELELAMRRSSFEVVPLSSALIVAGLLSAKFFPMISQIQQKVRAGKLGREDAVHELKAAYHLWLKAEISFESEQPPNLIPQLVHYTDTQLPDETTGQSTATSNAANIEPPTNKPSQSELARNELPTNANVGCKHETQDLLVNCETFELSFRGDENLFRSELPPANHNGVRLIDLLVTSKLVNADEAKLAYERILDDPRMSANMFIATGLLDQATCNAALKYHDLLAKHLITQQQALQSLHDRTSMSPANPDQLRRLDIAGSSELPEDTSPDGLAPATISNTKPKRRSNLKHALTAAVVGGIAAVAVMSRKR